MSLDILVIAVSLVLRVSVERQGSLEQVVDQAILDTQELVASQATVATQD